MLYLPVIISATVTSTGVNLGSITRLQKQKTSQFYCFLPAALLPPPCIFLIKAHGQCFLCQKVSLNSSQRCESKKLCEIFTLLFSGRQWGLENWKKPQVHEDMSLIKETENNRASTTSYKVKYTLPHYQQNFLMLSSKLVQSYKWNPRPQYQKAEGMWDFNSTSVPPMICWDTVAKVIKKYRSQNSQRELRLKQYLATKVRRRLICFSSRPASALLSVPLRCSSCMTATVTSGVWSLMGGWTYVRRV